MILRVSIAGHTDVGRQRRNNQDSFGVVSEVGLAVVCDGLGGLPGGEFASRIAVESFLSIAQQEMETGRERISDVAERALARAAAAANRAVRARAAGDSSLRGMGTTLVGAHIARAGITLVNVGDSRAYLLRGGSIRQLTRDHSYLAEQVRLGRMTEDDAAQSSLQSVITRAVGVTEDVQPDLYHEALQPGDLVLLCSDGLIRHVGDHEIAAAFSSLRDTADPERLCRLLIEEANAGGGSDNITCVAALIAPAASEDAG